MHASANGVRRTRAAFVVEAVRSDACSKLHSGPKGIDTALRLFVEQRELRAADSGKEPRASALSGSIEWCECLKLIPYIDSPAWMLICLR